jgi:hypothetical protein
MSPGMRKCPLFRASRLTPKGSVRRAERLAPRLRLGGFLQPLRP